MTRALRILWFANDGLSVGHVVRTLAIAESVRDQAAGSEQLLVTTSQTDALVAAGPFAVVRLPAPAHAQHAGWSDAMRRSVVGSVVSATVDSFAPDLIVVDTFPHGPHGELTGLGRCPRVLVRRTVAHPTSPALTTGLDHYDLAIVAADPLPTTEQLPIATHRVGPIVRSGGQLARADARRALGLEPGGRAMLVTAGGGGDREAAVIACQFARRVCERRELTVVVTEGPLAANLPPDARRWHTVRDPALHRLLPAFDLAIAAAGYNTAHELAAAGVPALLFARPRPFDDQRARANRFAAAGLAYAIERDQDLADGVEWAMTARPALRCDGARDAAHTLLAVARQERRR